MVEMNGDLKVFMDFKGFGNPNGEFWFIGIEEGKELSQENMDGLIVKYSQGIILSPPGEFENWNPPVYKKILEIVSKIKQYDMVWYRNNRLFAKGSEAFLTNLRPLGKKRSNSPLLPHYFSRLGLKSKEDYFEKVKTYRYPFLKIFWAECSPKITICFGKSGWSEFRELFQLHNAKRELIENGAIEFYSDKNIYLTPHFSRGWIDRNNLTTVLVNHITGRLKGKC